jgi:hypothetical protein
LAAAIRNRKLNPNWDSLLSLEQKQLLVKPGMGLSQTLPYLEAEDVKELMDSVLDCLNKLEERFNFKN